MIKQTSSSHQNIVVTCNDRLDKHIHYVNNHLTRLKKCCEDLLRFWQSAVDNHMKFQDVFNSCCNKLKAIKSSFLEGCPFNNDNKSTDIIDDDEVSFITKWSKADQIYTCLLVWLSDLTNRLDRFTIISYQSCTELFQTLSLTTGLKGRNSINEQLIEMKQSANQLSNDLIRYSRQIETYMIEHLRIIEEKNELNTWLNDQEQKLLEYNKPLEVLSFGETPSSSPSPPTSSVNSLNFVLSSWSTLVNERQSNLQNFRRVLQNLSSRSQQLRSFEERQSLAVLNYKTNVIDRAHKSSIFSDIHVKQLISDISSIDNLNNRYTHLVNHNKELINKLEKIIDQDTRFGDFANSLISEISALSDILLSFEETFFTMNSSIMIIDNNKLLSNSQDLWTRDFVQNKITELNQQIRNVFLKKNIYTKLDTFEEMFINSISFNEPEKNLASELINLIKNLLNQLEQKINEQIALFSLILNQMQDMSKNIDYQKNWFSQISIKMESLESQLPIDLQSKKTLLVNYQDILTDTTEHISEVNAILKNTCHNTPTLVDSQNLPDRISEKSTDCNQHLSSHSIKMYPADTQLVKSLKSLDHDMNHLLEKVNSSITRRKRAITRHENLIESIQNLEMMLSKCIDNIFYCAHITMDLENDGVGIMLLKFPSSSVLSKCINILRTYINSELSEVNRLLNDINLTYDSILQDTCPEHMNNIKLQIKNNQNQLTNLEHQMHTLQAYLINLTDRIELFISINSSINERIVNLSNRLKSESINLCSITLQEIKRYHNIWRGVNETAKQIHQDYLDEVMPLIEEFKQLKSEHVQFLKLYKYNFSIESINNQNCNCLLEDFSTVETITIQSIFKENNEKLSEITDFITVSFFIHFTNHAYAQF
ncbi:Nesprin-1 [Schistosoma japonicum]|nr:Nesprin-1 [Schistosoma japonicum]